MTQLNPTPTEKQVSAEVNQRSRNASRVAVLSSGANIVAIVFAIFLAWQQNAWQLYVLSGILTVVTVAFFASIRLIRAGRTETGNLILLIAPTFIFFPLGLLVSNLSLIAGISIAVLTYVNSDQILAGKKVRRAQIAGIGVGLLTAALSLLKFEFGLPVPVLQTFVPTIVGIFILAIGFFVARQAWIDGRIRNRIIVVLSAVLIPILVAFTWYNIQAQRQDLEKELTNKAETVAISGAATIGHLLEEAITNGDLTTEQVFDTSYVPYWEFDSAAYEFDGDPSSLNKYHTAYDTYTDGKWQNLLDSYLNQEDFVFTIPVDKNGYLPTHNTRWSSWDGSPATDRSKRIFNDPVGIKAAQNTQPTLMQVYPRPGTGETLLDISAPIFVDGEHWGAFRVGTVLVEDSLLAQSAVQLATRRSLVTSGLLIFGIVASAWFLGNYISKPLEKLSESASQLAGGQFGEFVDTTDVTELKTLANTYNEMTSQLKDLVGSLEQRVADRTKALATSAEVTRRLATVLDPDQLVGEVVQQVRNAFEYYYAQIYLLDEAGENLVIAGGTGQAGASMLASRHSVPKGRGLVGRAADTNTSVLVPDVSQEEGWLPNKLLPETKAETAIPISVGNQVLGVLDVQHNIVGGLTAEDVTLLESLAGQVAITLQNARTYEQSRSQAELESLVNVIGQKIQRTTSIEDTLQTAIQELGTAIGASRVRASLQPASSAVPTEPLVPAEPAVAAVGGEEAASETEPTPAD